jgi:rRNA-processing protein CGR1
MPGLEQRKLPRAKSNASRAKSADAKSAQKKWEKKKVREDKLARVKLLSKQLRDELNSDLKRAREAKISNEKRKADNEKQHAVIQKIRNVKAIKKMSPKQRRKARIYMQHEL